MSNAELTLPSLRKVILAIPPKLRKTEYLLNSVCSTNGAKGVPTPPKAMSVFLKSVIVSIDVNAAIVPPFPIWIE